MKVDAGRLWGRLEALAAITESERPWTRRSFTPRFLEGRECLAREFATAGLAVSIDAGGNLIGRREGREPGRRPVLMGSHSDTVPSGGRYDGVLGVLCALEVAQTLHEAGHELAQPLEVIDFLAEEPSEFGLSCVGSRAIGGALSAADLQRRRLDGISLAEGIAYVGGDPDSVLSIARGAGSTAAYLEVHIEQGRVLESEGIDIGIVTDIVGIRREKWIVTGRADHAGATPMNLRHDALVGASIIIREASVAAGETVHHPQPLVATIGHMTVEPNAANAVPGRVTMTLEVRSGDDAAVRRFGSDLWHRIGPEISSLGLEVTRQEISHALPTSCDEQITRSIDEAAAELGLSSRRMPSGAGHDGVFVARTGPIGMIFVPCLDGRSHAPEESITSEQAAAGAQVLLQALLKLDAMLD